MATPTFDLDAALAALREGKDLTGKGWHFNPLIKQLTEAAMKAELTSIWERKINPIERMAAVPRPLKARLVALSLTLPEIALAPLNPNWSRNTKPT